MNTNITSNLNADVQKAIAAMQAKNSKKAASKRIYVDIVVHGITVSVQEKHAILEEALNRVITQKHFEQMCLTDYQTNPKNGTPKRHSWETMRESWKTIVNAMGFEAGLSMMVTLNPNAGQSLQQRFKRMVNTFASTLGKAEEKAIADKVLARLNAFINEDEEIRNAMYELIRFKNLKTKGKDGKMDSHPFSNLSLMVDMIRNESGGVRLRGTAAYTGKCKLAEDGKPAASRLQGLNVFQPDPEWINK